jgi:diguanylate cyclase
MDPAASTTAGAGRLDGMARSTPDRLVAAKASDPPDGRSDDPLITRSRELMAIAQRGDDERRRAAVVESDHLVQQARWTKDPRLLAEILRAAGIVRLVTPGHLDDVRDTLDELLEHTVRHGLTVAEADGYALRANRAFRANPEDDVVLDELADALAIVEGDLPPDPLLDARDWAELVARALSDTAIVLHHLDIHEMAANLLAKGQHHLDVAGNQHGMVVLLFNRVRSLLLWGLQFERTGLPDAAAERFAAATLLAGEVEQPWLNNMFPDRPDQPAADQVVVFGVAFALHRPGAEHLPRLARLRQRGIFPDDPVLLDIAEARCLDRAGRPAEAVRLLERHPLEADPVDKSEPAVRLSLVRELARLNRTMAAEGAAWHRYVESLEAGLLSLQRARLSALRGRVEHAKLRRQHRVLARQVLQDALTGLPNRRALEEQLTALATAGTGQPICVAMIDLDGFKQVNDLYSHTAGDEVLKVIAATLRDSLRANDLVARYGGDEFVALLPATPLATAVALLRRAVSKVRTLPAALSQGVTLSVGVTMVDPTDTARSALVEADRAMYAAKRHGGSRVIAADRR